MSTSDLGLVAAIVAQDAGKKVKGRKRYIIVDTQGTLLAALITPAKVQDRLAARSLGLTIKVVSPPAGQRGSQVLPGQWMIECTLAWLDRYRLLTRDWEAASRPACAFIYIAASNLIARHLARLEAA